MEKEYEVCGRTYHDEDTAERVITSLFFDMCADLDIDHGDDSVAWREDFNNWTDGLHKDGLICESAYNDLCPVGALFE